ncbi:Hypothetical protein CINCED_3A021528 [Cinara cedri]|uniref:Uncharacterized protein n=1 Tax=Cinara cedri TaxID=506608 RepID=A0A5E4LZB0_9HEMI|nr:Hypothetical protein CINCED_3A021528 [Cinara cedri]
MGRKSGKASKLKRHSSLDNLTGRPYSLTIDRNQMRQVNQIDYPQNGHEYLYMAKKMDGNLPPVMTATNIELQQYINKYENSAREYKVPKLELLNIKNKKILPTKVEIMSYIEQYDNSKMKIQENRKCIIYPHDLLPTSNSPAVWFKFLFGREINSMSPVNPVHNIEKSAFFFQSHCATVISYFVQWIMKKIITTSDVTSWTFSVYVSMDSDPCETLLSDMRILTQMFINARATIEDHLDVSALQYSCLINLVSEKFKQHDLSDIINYKDHYSGSKDKK